MLQLSRLIGILPALLLLAGCATAPKPQELLDLEELRQGQPYQKALEKEPTLIKESDEAYQKSDAAWKDEKLDDAKHWATLAMIKARTALTIVAQAAAGSRAAEIKKQLAKLAAERQELSAKVRDADEKLQLHGKLSAARKAALAKEAELSEAQKREEAQRKLADAQLALKLADTVEAAKYSQADYASAQALLRRADELLKAGSTTDAAATAAMAKSKAESAYAGARPQFQSARQAADRQAQNQALQKDAAAIGGVTVKMKTVGQTQQLIIPVLGCFAGAKVMPKPEKKMASSLPACTWRLMICCAWW